jgi:hypothetical protein
MYHELRIGRKKIPEIPLPLIDLKGDNMILIIDKVLTTHVL